jgi:ABC-2 type transport system ATP-binding protein
MPAAPAIEVAALEKRYGAVRAVDGLSLTVGSGEVFGLLGPNGAGKTTTVEILEGYRRRDAGRVQVLGLDPWRDGSRLRPRIGVMLQDGGLYPGIRPLGALRLFASYYDDPDDPDALLDRVGLSSGGRHWCSSTSPPPAWTRAPAAPLGPWCASFAARGRPSC